MDTQCIESGFHKANCRCLASLNDFQRAYIECALWASLDSDGEPLDVFDPYDIAPSSLGQMVKDCEDFVSLADQSEALAEVLEHPGHAGHDFWLTRNGHGAGFWDGAWRQGGKLTQWAESFGECSLYVGDDGKLHHFDG